MSTATALPDTTGLAATVRQYIESFNSGDPKAMAAMCADPMSILDGMAPHVWHGATASEDWYRDVQDRSTARGSRAPVRHQGRTMSRG